MISRPLIRPLAPPPNLRDFDGECSVVESIASFVKQERWEGFVSEKIQDPLGLLTVGEDGIVVAADAAACRLFGKPEEGVVGRALGDFFSGDGKVEALLRQSFAKGEVSGGEFRLNPGDGPWCHAIFIPEKNAGFRRVAVVGFDGIHDYLLMGRTAIEVSGDAVYWITPDATIVDVNSVACASSGYERDQLVGAKIEKIDPILTREVWDLAFRSLRANGSLKMESVHRKKCGAEVPVEISLASVSRKERELACAFVRNIQDRKRMKENLLKLRMAVEQSANTIVITDKSGTIEYVNAAFTKTSGYTFSEAIGKNPSVLKSGLQSEKFYKELWETILQGQIWRGMFHNKKKDGTSYWESATISPILDSAGNIFRFIAVKEDITSQRLSEKKIEDLRQRLAMSEQDERKRIASALHDSTVQDLVAVHLDIHRAVGMIGSEYSQARDILMDAMAIIENNANELRSLAYDLHAPWLLHGGLFSGIETYARKFAVRSGICATVEAVTPIPRISQIKEISLYRIVQESLTNVLRHSSASRVWIRFEATGENLEVSICDDGGATPEVLEYASSNPLGGIGILSMRERIEAVGGALSVSREPEGVCVRALVPIFEDSYELY